MATPMSDVVKQSYVKIKSKRFAIWQRRWLVFRRASSKGGTRFEKYVDERGAIGASNGRSIKKKVISLSNVKTVSRLPSESRKHSFAIYFLNNTSMQIACNSETEADAWIKCLQQEYVGRPVGISSGEPDILTAGIQKEMKERFHVYLLPTPNLDLRGECLLQVTHENIYLWDVSNPRLKVVAWPLTALRRYGSDPTKFTFEAGRHCSTGEGMFIFHTNEGEQIYNKVHQATLSIADAHMKLVDEQDESSEQSRDKSEDIDEIEDLKRVE